MYDSLEKTRLQLSEDIFPAQAWELISKHRGGDNLVIIDVSTPMEYKSLHLEGAINVSLFSRFFKSRIGMMDKNKTYVVYCKVGGRSKMTQKLMQKLRFQTVYNIKGGTFLWKEEGLPVAQGTAGLTPFSFCPVLISIVMLKKVKKVLNNFSSRISQHGNTSVSHGKES